MKDTLPDYTVAREELAALFASLKLDANVSEPIGIVEDGWPCISYQVQIGNEVLSYKMGIGHVKWKIASPAYMLAVGIPWQHVENIIDATVRGKTLHAKHLPAQARIAALLAKRQKVAPSPAEVLASYARDGNDAKQPFDDWCSGLGYDTDSRKALSIYEACTEAGKKARRLLGRENAQRFAELAARL